MWRDIIFWQVLPEEKAKASSLWLSLLRLSFSEILLSFSSLLGALSLWDRLMILSRGHFQFPRKPTPWPSNACEEREWSRLGSPSVASFIPWHERDGREVVGGGGIRVQEGDGVDSSL